MPAGTSPSEVAGCEYLAKFLIVLPSILSQACLSMQVVEDTTIVLKELSNFLALHHKELFHARFHPPREEYLSERTVPPLLASRLQNLRPAVDDSSLEMTEMTEAILPEDDELTTDFVKCSMGQVVPCRASHDDVSKKNRRINLGFKGLMCRHCMGSRGEGRYFFTSIESMTTAATVIEKHLEKCPSVPVEVKKRLRESRTRHAEQRRELAQGAQARYFLRLWERLRSSVVRDTVASLQVLELQHDFEDEEESTTVEFHNHVDVLRYISNTPPWCEKPNILEEMARYSECLESGGRAYNTEAMPRRFTGELWMSKFLHSNPSPHSA